jgi:cytoskeletal protein RodZ
MAQSVVVDATSRRALPTILGMAVLLLVLAALGGWLVWYGFRQWTAKPTPAAATATEVRPRPDPVAPPASTAVTPPPLAVKTPVKPAPSAAALPAPSNPQPAMAMQPVPAEALAAKPAASPAAAVNPASPAAAVVPEKTAWPVLNVSGLVGKGARGAAIINRQVVGVDETIEGARVISIERQGVKIEFQGETQLFKVGSAGR